MTTDREEKGSRDSGHRWRFFRSGGFDQVCLESGDDLLALDQLDQKLWVALSCPIRGLEFDAKTLELIDGAGGDGRIRVPDLIAAVKWAGAMLRNPDDLTKRLTELPLSAIDDRSPEGRQLIASAREILMNLGKPEAEAITVEDTTDTARIFAQSRFNGDGLIPADAADDPAVQKVITDIIACLGSNTDRSGKPAVSREITERFFADARAYARWLRETETDSDRILPFGEATAAAAAAFQAVKGKVDDYFTRCRLVQYDPRALGALNRQETEYIAIAQKDLTPAIEEVAGFPLARVGGDTPLPLTEGINPAWSVPMAAFATQVVTPLLGEKTALSEAEWLDLGAKFTAHEAWLARKAGASVEKLGIARIREILEGRMEEAVTELIDRDKALEAEFDHIASVDRLVRYHRYLFQLLNNFVSFRDFYDHRRALFQAGTLYLDGRSCDLCIRVEDIGKHATLAVLSRIYLAYCDCTRKGGTERMTIAAAFTGGDSDYLMVGRNGVFYDRNGEDWDATIVRVIEHPISIRQAFWSPYKRIGRMIGDQIAKIASARDKAVTETAGAGIAAAGQKVDAGKAAPPAPPFDVAKFAGIFAAIGLAVGAIGTAIAAVVTGFLNLSWWQMPIAVAGLILLISGPSMITAWLKLRQRTIGPILDANGWAINGRVRINVAFGGSLTKLAVLPEGAARSLEDPFADKKSRWPKILVAVALILVLLYLLNLQGLFPGRPCGVIGTKPAVTGVVPGGGGEPPKAAAIK